MNDSTSKATAPSITVRPTLEEKRLFSAIAARRRMSESALALVAIRSLLDSDVPGLPSDTLSSGPAVDESRSGYGQEIEAPSGIGRLSAT